MRHLNQLQECRNSIGSLFPYAFTLYWHNLAQNIQKVTIEHDTEKNCLHLNVHIYGTPASQ